MSIHAKLNKYRKVTRICKIELVWGVVVGLVAEHLAEVVMEEADRPGSLHHEVEEFARSLRSIRQWQMQPLDGWATTTEWKSGRGKGSMLHMTLRMWWMNSFDALRPSGTVGRPLLATFTDQGAAPWDQCKKEDVLVTGRWRGALFCGSTANASYNNRRLSDPQKMEDSDVVGICRPKGELVEKLLSEDQGIVIISVVALWVWVALSRPHWFLESSTRASQQREDSSALLGSPFPK